MAKWIVFMVLMCVVTHGIDNYLINRKEKADEEYLAKREARRQEIVKEIGDKSRWDNWEEEAV